MNKAKREIMSTPATLKKLEEKKAAAQKRKEKQTQAGDQLVSLSSQANAPSSHLLVRTEPVEGAPPRHILPPRPLTGQFMNYRERKEDFSTDVSDERPYGGMHYTSFETGAAVQAPPIQPIQPQGVSIDQALQVLQPLSRPNNYYNQRQQQASDRANAAKVKKEAMAVVPLPANVATWELTVRPDQLVCFHGKTNFLSQLYPISLTVDGNEYQSMEHYYQACKLFSLAGAQAAQELRSIKDPLKAKMRTRDVLQSLGVGNDRVEHWKCTHGVLVLIHAMKCKFSTEHPELRAQLLATGDALLVQAYDRDSFYAAGQLDAGVREWAKQNEGKVLKFPTKMNDPESVKYLPLVGKGKNVLGSLAMHIRYLLRTGQDQDIPQQQGTTATAPMKGQADQQLQQQGHSEFGYDDDNEHLLSPEVAKMMSTLNMSGDEDDDLASCTSKPGGEVGKENSGGDL